MKKLFSVIIIFSLQCMLFTAISNANLGIISQFAAQNDNHWVGPLSIALIFLGSAVGSLYNKYIGKFEYSKILFIGALGWDIYLSFSVIFLFVGFSTFVIIIILIGSVTCGIIVSIYYNSLFNYINQCGKIDQCVGFYFGLNTCIIQSANILGNALSASLIQPLGQKYYSFIMLVIVIFVSFGFLKTKSLKQYSIYDTNKQQLVQKNNTYVQNKFNKTPKILFFVFSVSGIIISFIYGQFSILFFKKFDGLLVEQVNKICFISLMIQGCGQFVGGLIYAFISKKVNKYAQIYIVNSFFFLLIIGVMIIAFQNKQISLIYLFSFFLGISDCFCFSLALDIGGTWSQSGISLFNFGQSFTVFAASICNIFLQIQQLSKIYLVIILISSLILLKYRKIINNHIVDK